MKRKPKTFYLDQLLAEVSKKTGVTIKEAGLTVAALVDVMKTHLFHRDRVSLKHLGFFELRDYAPRACRNPHTGEKMLSEARTKVVFKPTKVLRDV